MYEPEQLRAHGIKYICSRPTEILYHVSGKTKKDYQPKYRHKVFRRCVKFPSEP